MLQLRSLRKQYKISQVELASRLGVTQATLSGWETEKYEIDNKSLRLLSEIFNVSIDYLLGHESKKEKPAENDELKEKNVKFIGRDGSVKFKKLSPEMIAMLEQLPDSGDDL